MPARSAWMRFAAVAAALLVSAPMARAEGLRRLVGRMDFEADRESGQDLPRGWDKGALPTGRFPKYVKGQLTEAHAHTGKVSFAMSLNGGNVAYTYTRGITVFPDSDYLLTGYVRTASLVRARAQVRVTMYDAADEPVAGTTIISEPIGTPGGPTDGKWHPFRLNVRGSFKTATKLRITLCLLQPDVWQGASGKNVYQQDIRGTVWWDDIAVYRLPRISLWTGISGNVFAPGAPPRVKIRMEGMDYTDCAIALTIRDGTGRVYVQRIVDREPAAGSDEWTLPLGSLPPGYYVAELAISSGGKILERQQCRFVRLPDVPTGGKTNLGVDASSMPPESWPMLRTMLRYMRFDELKLSAWEAAALGSSTGASQPGGPILSGPEGAARARGMSTILADLSRIGVRPVMVFGNLPEHLRLNAGASGLVLDAMVAGDARVPGQMALLMARYGRQARGWQLRSTHEQIDPWADYLAEGFKTTRALANKLLVADNASLAWHASYAYDLPVPGKLSLLVSPSGMPEQIPGQLAAFAGRLRDVHLQLPAEQVDRAGLLGSLALRFAYARAGGARTIFIDPPWRVDQSGHVEPTELLLTARVLGAYLGDSQYVGTIRINDAAVALAFRKASGEGLMLVHARPNPAYGTPTEATMPLPRGAYSVDLIGRRKGLARRGGQAVLRPSVQPFIVGGCDAEALAMLASLRLTPEFIETFYRDHRLQLSFTNPHKSPVRGRLRIAGPARWTVQPETATFALGPNQTWTGELTVRFPYNVSAGLKGLNVTIDIEAPEAKTVQGVALLALGLRAVSLQVTHELGPDGVLEVQQRVINRSNKPQSFHCFAQVPGRPRQSRVISNLASGASAVKLFRFNRAGVLRGKALRCGLREVDGPAVLNHSELIR